VWRAYDPQRAQVVALKRLSLDRLYDPEARERRLGSARAELAAASRLRHPGIARVHAFGLDDAQRAYIVQEYVEGPSLRARMSASRSTSAGRVLDVAGKIARALQTLHRANVVHRDLKPENVILRLPHEHPVLIDFGLVLVADGPLDAASIVGTPAYMAPEQLAGRPVAGPCDLYALGVILYEWWAGCRPLQLNAASYEENLHVLTNRAPDPIAGLRPDLGLECTELVDALLEKDPADRPTVDDVAAHCEEWARKLLGRG
jgi:serine/threonine-protein kinase